MSEASDSLVATVQLRRTPGDVLSLDLPALRVTVLDGPDAGAEALSSQGYLTVGSGSKNHLRLADPAVSRRHCELRLNPQGIRLLDLGSTNGTFVSEVEVAEARLRVQDTFRIGSTTVRVATSVVTKPVVPPPEAGLGALVGSSPVMRQLFSVLSAVAETEIGVLIQGESGTGKELVAQEIHRLSGRKGPLVVFDAGVADPEMIRSDLFGHEPGAFTGASSARKGAFREAEGGTLFIDEVGELPLELQPRLLRVLEARQVAPMGSDRHYPVYVRVVAATHRDLAEMVSTGRFREDLFHRLAVMPLMVPPLRDRSADIPEILAALGRKLSVRVEFQPDAMDAVLAHSWPGNVRALKNLLERLSVLVRGRKVEVSDLGLPSEAVSSSAAVSPQAGAPSTGGAPLQILERQAILAALKQHDGNQRKAAAALNISLATLKRRVKKYREEGSYDR